MRLAGFDRVGLGRLPGAGVAATYVDSDPEATAEVTVALRPAPSVHTLGLSADAAGRARDEACSEDFAGRSRSLAAIGHAAVRRQRLFPATRNGTRHVGREAELAYETVFDGWLRSVRTRLLSFCGTSSGWTLEFVATWAEGADAPSAVDAFESGFIWGERLAAAPDFTQMTSSAGARTDRQRG